MKNFNIYITVFLTLLSTIVTAQNKEMHNAIEKGKSDLIEILNKTGKDFDFGLDAKRINAATAAHEIPYSQVKFEGLLNYEGGGINSILTNTEKYVVPLVIENQVITTISISEIKRDSYQVTELINQQFSNELNMLPEEVKQNDFSNLSMFYVPNLNATVYNVLDKSYTSYDGSSLKRGQDTKALLEKLKIDAITFQDKYGEILKKQKLVK